VGTFHQRNEGRAGGIELRKPDFHVFFKQRNDMDDVLHVLEWIRHIRVPFPWVAAYLFGSFIPGPILMRRERGGKKNPCR
jgi:hypothetical protein